MEQAETRILDLILRSLRERRALCEVVLATYRVELTRTLNRMAGTGTEPGDLDHVYDLSERIAAAADAVGLESIHDDAVALRACTARAVEQGGGKRVEGALLVAGLKVIDRILDTASVGRKPDAQPMLS